MTKNGTIGFIMLRHVDSEKTNAYWIYGYQCIRRTYPDHWILIIDDNSNYEHITSPPELHKVAIIKSEYPKRGELLPYYYYLKNRLFDTAVILHDSVFVNNNIDVSVDTYKMIWDFDHRFDQIEDETKMIKVFDDPALLSFYEDKTQWRGCFGAMTVITHDFLTEVNRKYEFRKLLDLVLTRYNRSSFERVLACMLQIHGKTELLLGGIDDYMPNGVPFEFKHVFNCLPFVKVWTGR